MISISRKKKVLILPSWYPSKESPINGIFIREQARFLACRFDVTVLTPRFPSLEDLLRLRWGPELIRENDAGIPTWRVRQLKIPTLRRWLHFSANPDHVLVYYRKFAAAVRRGFSWYVRQQGLPDVLHAHVVLPAGWVAVQLAKEFRVPMVLTEHSGPFAMHLASPKQQGLVREVLSGTDRLVAVSPPLREAMKAFCPEVEVEVIGNLVDTDFFTPGTGPDPGKKTLRFFFLGQLLENKGAQYLLQAAQMLRTQGFKGFEVRLGGDGPYRPILERMAVDLGIEDRCLFLGMLDRAKVREQMRSCDVFVLPSLGETFGIVLGEALACGKPVLSTRSGGPEYVVTPECGILVAPADARELAGAMAGFLTGRYSFEAERIRASVVRRFGGNAFLEQIEWLYADACLHHRGADQAA